MFTDMSNHDDLKLGKTIGALFAPLEFDDFLADHWQKTPCVIRNRGAQWADRLFTSANVDEFLARVAPSGQEVDFFKAKSALPKDAFVGVGNHVDLSQLYTHYTSGGTIHVTNMQKYWPSLTRLCRAGQAAFGCHFESDFWLTNANELEPYLHYDGHDVFALQISGRKHWKIYAPLDEPSRHDAGQSLDRKAIGQPLYDFVTEPGDLIYMPWGTPHEVLVRDGYSLHIGFGAHPPSWADLLERMARSVATGRTGLSAKVPLDILKSEDRVSLAADVLRALADEITSPASVSSAFADMDAYLLDRMRTAQDGHLFSQILERPTLSEDTQLKRRDGFAVLYSEHSESSAITFNGGGGLDGPPELAPALRMAAHAHSFKVRDLPDCLEDDAKVVFAEILLDRGLMQIDQAAN